MNKHFCQGFLPYLGRRFWGDPSEGPPGVDPVPQEVLDRHPDVVIDWGWCDRCEAAICGKPACHRLRFSRSGLDAAENIETVWLCSEHYDEVLERQIVNWHECRD